MDRVVVDTDVVSFVFKRDTRAELLRRFAIHPYDAALCRTWAVVSHSAQESGRPINAADAWIAATAVHHGLPLVTHNQTHYAGIASLVVITESWRPNRGN